MSVVETVDCKGNKIKFEWDYDRQRLERVIHTDGTVAERVDEALWRVMSAASGAVEQEFQGDIRVDETGALTVTLETTARLTDSVTLSLDGRLVRKVKLQGSISGRKGTFQLKQWSNIDGSDIGSGAWQQARISQPETSEISHPDLVIDE